MPKLRELTPFFSAQSLLKECNEHLSDMRFALEEGTVLNDVVHVNVRELKRLCEFVLQDKEVRND
jgi:hypothetical protein